MSYLITCYNADQMTGDDEGVKGRKPRSHLSGIKHQISVSAEIYFHLPVSCGMWVLRGEGPGQDSAACSGGNQ